MTTSSAPIEDERQVSPDALAELDHQGIRFALVSSEADLDSIRADDMPSVALVETVAITAPELRQCARRCSEMRLPVIALVGDGVAEGLDPSFEFDDFVLMPPRPGELVTRTRWVLNRTAKLAGDDLVRVGDLVVNPTNYEVSVGGRRVNLRFKEYELLLLMATSPGRVFTRETLLNRIWGYDYLGGTRTVDVHVRRLRSKIEDADHRYIETVWQVGYKFKDIKRMS